MNAFLAENIGQFLLDKVKGCAVIESMTFACGAIVRYTARSSHKI
jgi:hypothetical protein